MTSENLQIGARGWRHAHWQDSYYPDDLPEEWQLTFYANDFSVVLVPVEYWDKQNGYDLESWLDEVEEDFSFYLEAPSFNDEAESHLFQSQCQLMGEQLGGVLITEMGNVTDLEVPCPVVKNSAAINVKSNAEKLDIGLITQDYSDLRKIRTWLESFDKQSVASQKVVFVTNLDTPDVNVNTILEIKTLIEMMGL